MHKPKSTKLHINEDVTVAIVSDNEEPVVLSIPDNTETLGNFEDDFESGRYLTYDDIFNFANYDEDDIIDDYEDFDDAPVIVMDDEDYSDYNERALGYADDIAD